MSTITVNERDRSPGGLRRLLVVAAAVATLVAPAIGASAQPVGPGAPVPVIPAPAPTSVPPAPVPAPAAPPTSTGSITVTPVPSTTTTQTPSPTTVSPSPSSDDTNTESDGDADCGLTHIGGCVTNAIDGFFRGVVRDALNPLLTLLSTTLLTTPTPGSLPRIRELWDNSWQVLLGCYGLLIMLAGIAVMGYETVQTRYTLKEVAPRIVVGFVAGAFSLAVATQAIEVANAVAVAVGGGDLSADSAGQNLRNVAFGALNGGIFTIFIGIFLAGMIAALLVTYVVRLALTVMLIAGAPIALMFHALPQTEGIAQWWWKAFGGCLAIQVVQSLTLATAMRVFLAPDGFSLFGPTKSGLVDLIVALALMLILYKIPFWILGSLRIGNGRSMVGSLVRGFIAYKAMGLLKGAGSGGGTGGARSRAEHSGGGGKTSDPYANTRADARGQYMLPLSGLKKVKPPAKARPTRMPPTRGTRGRQLSLPLDGEWPENKPVLQRDGQYRLPIPVKKVSPPPPPPPTPAPPRSGLGRQLSLPLDGEWPENKPVLQRDGQYRLPIDAVQVPRPPTAKPTSGAGKPGRPPGKQLELPFTDPDPYKGNRPMRSGQYPLPLGDLHRVPHPKPPPPPPPPAPVKSAGRQLQLPLKVPKPRGGSTGSSSGGRS